MLLSLETLLDEDENEVFLRLPYSVKALPRIQCAVFVLKRKKKTPPHAPCELSVQQNLHKCPVGDPFKTHLSVSSFMCRMWKF